MENIKEKISNYFNIVLRNSLKYGEDFDVDANSFNKILLLGNKKSQLIDLIKIKTNLKSNIEQSLLKGFSAKDPNIKNISLNIFNDYNIIIMIIYGERMLYLDTLYEDLYAVVASYLRSKDLSSFCESNDQLKKLCKEDSFWHRIFNERFGTAVGKVDNYKILYENMLSYLENKIDIQGSDNESLINLISKKLVNKFEVRNLGLLLQDYAIENNFPLIKLILDNYIVDYFDLYDSLVFSLTNDKRIINAINSNSVLLGYGVRDILAIAELPKNINLEQIKIILNSKGSGHYDTKYISEKHLFIMLGILNRYNYKLPDEVMNILKEHIEGKGKNL